MSISKRHARWLYSAAFVIATSPALAQDINTVPDWNGTTFISSWGVPNTATYGQTITPTGSQGRLNGFTFYLQQQSGTAPNFQAFVYAWDSINSRITGSALFTSSILTAPSGAGFQPVSISTGGVTLAPGQQYVLFLTTSTLSGQPSGSYRYGSLSNNTTYAGGQFVFMNNGTDFSQLSSNTWSFISEDLAFIALFTPAGLPINQQNVSNAIFNFTGVLPTAFSALVSLPEDQYKAALSQASGENNAGAQQSSIQLMNSFMSVLTDTFNMSRLGGGGAPMGYAPEAPSKLTASPTLAAAYAQMVTKAPARLATSSPWSVWASVFGGRNETSGEPQTLGSNDTVSKAGGFAVGADYRLSPDTVVGFSLAGGLTDWTVSRVGDGQSQSLLGGVYGSYRFGAAYVSGALTAATHFMDTSRQIGFVPAQVTADFNAQSYGARLEGGYKLTSVLAFDVTPFAAVQVQSFQTPNYTETAVGAPFALNIASRDATALRTELGARLDKTFVPSFAGAGSMSKVFVKAAWAHDEIDDPTLSASFVGLPGASFIVNGARPASDLALVSAGAELLLPNNLSLMAKFDGEFGDHTTTVSGTARLRYSW